MAIDITQILCEEMQSDAILDGENPTVDTTVKDKGTILAFVLQRKWNVPRGEKEYEVLFHRFTAVNTALVWLEEHPSNLVWCDGGVVFISAAIPSRSFVVLSFYRYRNMMQLNTSFCATRMMACNTAASDRGNNNIRWRASVIIPLDEAEGRVDSVF